MTTLEFSYALAQQIYFSDQAYPINLDDAWVWLGYSSKQKALQKLRANFVEGQDFLTKWLKTNTGGRPSDCIMMSVDTFKSLGMMAGTAKGREIRQYFLQCEDQLKQLAASNKNAIQSTPEQRLQIGMNALQFFSIDQTNPRYAQGLQDWCLNLMLGQKQLPESTERWLGVAERAEELGYGRIGADLSLRTRLGTFVSKCDLERKREERLCNGTQRKIWIYRVCDEFDAVIVNFFEAQP